MSVSENIKSRKITRSMCAFNTGRRKSKLFRLPAAFAQNNASDVVICGEAISAGEGICIASDGKVYLSIEDATSNKPVDFIAAESGQLDDKIRYISSGLCRSGAYSFAVGGIVRLAVGDSNISTDASTFTVGDYYQELGIAIAENEFILNVGVPLIVE